MPEIFSSSRLLLTVMERPHCPKCGAQMTFASVAQEPSGFDIRTFDCDKCDHTHIVTVATDPMKSDEAGWLQASDLKAPT